MDKDRKWRCTGCGRLHGVSFNRCQRCGCSLEVIDSTGKVVVDPGRGGARVTASKIAAGGSPIPGVSGSAPSPYSGGTIGTYPSLGQPNTGTLVPPKPPTSNYDPNDIDYMHDPAS